MELSALPITETEFFNITMSKTPDVKQGGEYTIKKGDSLWGIAQKELGKNAKNSEILDYMYKIAKLNNLKSKREMNSLRVNDKIYLPEEGVKPQKQAEKPSSVTNKKPEPQKDEPAKTAIQSSAPAANKKAVDKKVTKPVTSTAPAHDIPEMLQVKEFDVTKFNITEMQGFNPTFKFNAEQVRPPFATDEQLKAVEAKKAAQVKKAKPAAPAKKVQTPKVVTKPKNNAEQGFDVLKSGILSTKKENLHVDCGFKALGTGVYTVYRMDDKNPYIRKQLATFTMDKKGNLVNIFYNGKVDEIAIRYDYKACKNGSIVKEDEFNLKSKVVGSVDKNAYKQIEAILKDKVTVLNQKYPGDVY